MLWRCNFFLGDFLNIFLPILLQINPSDYIPSFIKIGWGVGEKIVEESHIEIHTFMCVTHKIVCTLQIHIH